MKTLILTLALALTSACLLQAGELERLRSSAHNIDISASLQDASSVPQGEITPIPVFSAIAEFFRLLFTPDGGVEIDNPPSEVIQVDGELDDDDAQETYSQDQVYAPLEEEKSFPRQDTKSVSVPAGQVPQDLLRKAQDYFHSNSGRIPNKNFMGIIDFSRHSSKARFYIMDMRSGSVRAIRVSHGKGSDSDHDGYATKFSNTANSNASSLGFYLTAKTYIGKHGKSMRLQGLSSTNSNAMSRAIVIHEATYVQEANVKQGRSFGCPAVAAGEIANIISSLRGGALIYGGLSNSDF